MAERLVVPMRSWDRRVCSKLCAPVPVPCLSVCLCVSLAGVRRAVIQMLAVHIDIIICAAIDRSIGTVAPTD